MDDKRVAELQWAVANWDRVYKGDHRADVAYLLNALTTAQARIKQLENEPDEYSRADELEQEACGLEGQLIVAQARIAELEAGRHADRVATDRWAWWGENDYRWWIDRSVYYRVQKFDALWWCQLYCDGKEEWRKQFSSSKDEAMQWAVQEQRRHEAIDAEAVAREISNEE